MTRRGELLDAAVRTIRRDGPNASMDDIAAEAGLTKPILYSTFGDKAGLAGALAQKYLGDMLPAVLAAFTSTGATQAEPREMVRSAIDVFIGFVDDDPQVYRFLVRGVSTDERSFIEQQLITEFGLRLAQVLRSALRMAGADSGPAELWAFSILGTVLAGAEWWQARPSMSRADVVDYLTAFVWGGLTAGGVVGLDATSAFGGHGTDGK
jgi:AcrR family transcriptional regulator